MYNFCSTFFNETELNFLIYNIKDKLKLMKEGNHDINIGNFEKKEYVSPVINMILIKMECGIAANSVAVSPVTVGGNTDQVQTDWGGNDDTTIDTPF